MHLLHADGDLLQLNVVGEPLSSIASIRATTRGRADGAPGLALCLAVLGDATTLRLTPGGAATPTTARGLEALPSWLLGLIFNLEGGKKRHPNQEEPLYYRKAKFDGER